MEKEKIKEIQGQIALKKKFILDACCGSRMFWFNKKHPNTIYIDCRQFDKGFIDNRPNRELHPDLIMDFRKLEFPDKSFKLVVMDPPHLISKPNGCRMTKTYGCLIAETWQNDLRQGFKECWRVLDDYGVLIFKWNESSIKKKKVLKLFNDKPLFGHPVGSKVNTHWLCFMKLPKKRKLYNKAYIPFIRGGFQMNGDIKKQTNTSLILEVLKENPDMRRGELYKEVMKRQERKFGKSSTYQVISRDVDRLKSSKIIRVVSGGQRSEILAIN